MELKNILSSIQKEQENFSPAQKKVAAYVWENYKKIPFLSITALAENIGVSHYTVTKFCNRLGYARFSEFKRDLSEYTRELVLYNKLSKYKSVESSNDTDRLFEQTMSNDIDAVQSALTDLDNRKNLLRFLDMIDVAQSVYVTGGRASSYFAGLFSCFLRYLDLKVFELCTDRGDYWDRLSMIHSKDLVIAFAFPRYTSEVVNGLIHLHAMNVPIVLITNVGLSPVGAFADIIFRCKVESSSYLYCYTGCLALINIICRAAGIRRNQQASSHMRDLEKLLLDHGVWL